MSIMKDRLSRPLQDLRISITDKCNFRCQYCMPADIFGPDFKFLPKNDILSFEEIERLAAAFSKLGVSKLRITGGEPLLRKDVASLISRLHQIPGIKDIGLTTNGVLLPRLAIDLVNAGLHRVNVSLDALNDDIFKKINGRGVSSKVVLKGIKAARDAGLGVKVNMVVQKGVNESEIIPMARHFKDMGVALRYIEFMDVGNSNGWDFSKVVTKKEIFGMLSDHFDLEPMDPNYFGEVAKRYRYKNTDTEVGFITSVSESFCSSCTRARISADGKFYTCLFASKGYDLRGLVRACKEEEPLINEISSIWNQRKDRYSDERTEESAKSKEKIEMSYIGG
ncbi:cyclic pyranopterin monophosphate synthase [Siminovitchia terrae]|uniref:GTP 3',8-cyclase n=1 Tax=Siminovitchia terrae TaxID=1914933 RepID=A0ABQ4L6N4_SIMTE|nr:GTP 3',8-cyclase MoaA [Siminovitchia terrae]GIN91027.1 cyclic pyranopterin monophosphate synthase [Siminovitchia terrae]GIN99247.1 cyclic pyranopterin monophosphate synthase [Siminovitchia terrae]